MIPAELLHSRLLRIAAACAAIFGLCFTALVIGLYVSYSRFLEAQQREAVQAELDALVLEYTVDGPSSTAAIITLRADADAAGHWAYLLIGRDGGRLAGTLADWPGAPVDRGGWIELVDRAVPALARAATLPDGARLLVGLDAAQRRKAQRAVLAPIASAVVGGAVLSLLIGWLVARAAQRPIERMNAVARQIMAGDLSRRLPQSGAGDEFDRIAATMNELLDQIERSVRTIKGATDDIAHDLRTPLARLRLRLEALAARATDPATRQAVAPLLDEVDTILDTFGALLQIATVESGALRAALAPTDLRAIVADACELYSAAAEARQQHLHYAALEAATVRGHRDLLFGAVGNLLDNAIKYSPPGTAIEVRLACAAGAALVSVADRGPGIAPADRERAVQRLVRLDPARHTPGHGLGLSLVRAVATLHGGALRLEDHAPGLRAVLQLPLAGAAGT